MLFFFQAEDGIRDWSVTGVQTCALPITDVLGHLDVVVRALALEVGARGLVEHVGPGRLERQIGRASCRERV